MNKSRLNQTSAHRQTMLKTRDTPNHFLPCPAKKISGHDSPIELTVFKISANPTSLQTLRRACAAGLLIFVTFRKGKASERRRRKATGLRFVNARYGSGAAGNSADIPASVLSLPAFFCLPAQRRHSSQQLCEPGCGSISGIPRLPVLSIPGEEDLDSCTCRPVSA